MIGWFLADGAAFCFFFGFLKPCRWTRLSFAKWRLRGLTKVLRLTDSSSLLAMSGAIMRMDTRHNDKMKTCARCREDQWKMRKLTLIMCQTEPARGGRWRVFNIQSQEVLHCKTSLPWPFPHSAGQASRALHNLAIPLVHRYRGIDDAGDTIV
jgi:hypothetical protein